MSFFSSLFDVDLIGVDSVIAAHQQESHGRQQLPHRSDFTMSMASNEIGGDFRLGIPGLEVGTAGERR